MTSDTAKLDLLSGLSVVELGPGLAGAVCGRSFAEAGADVVRQSAGSETDNAWLAVNEGKRRPADPAEIDRRLRSANLVIVDATPAGANAA